MDKVRQKYDREMAKSEVSLTFEEYLATKFKLFKAISQIRVVNWPCFARLPARV